MKLSSLPVSLLVVVLCLACKTKEFKTTGSIERLDSALDAIIKPDAVIEIISEGHEWSEGPLWIETPPMLLFSDVPKNTVYKWTEENGTQQYLMPSGHTLGINPKSKEPGSNGLTLNKEGKLVLCQHGDRRMAIMNAALDKPASTFVSLADNYQGRKFNSPNDAVFNSNGDLFFTDPPYGLPAQDESDPLKEIPFQGVYKVSASGTVTLLVDTLTRPNGIALSPDEKTLVVANSDGAKVNWYAFDIAGDSLTNARIFYSAAEASKTAAGLPDGLKFDKQGNLFASGPGGIWIFSPAGKVLGKILISGPASNCALADNDKTLYITNDMNVLRIKMR